MTSAVPSPTDVLEEVDALGPPGTPVTTPEVAAGFDCTQRTIYNRLESLVDDGTLKTKKVGANSRVWWRPVHGERPNRGRDGREGPAADRPERSHFVAADGEMAERIREFGWAEGSLGPIREWPSELRVAVDLMLGADEAIAIFWGDDRTFLYNDAVREQIGQKHPDALGRPAREVFPEAWETLEPIHEQVMNGESMRVEEQYLPLERGETVADVWFDASFSPIRHVDGSVAGVFNVAVDVTDRVQAESALRKRKRESEQRYQTVLNSMDEGFFLADVVFDEDGEPLDIFYRDSNPAAAELVGETFEGRWLTQIDTGYEEHWYEVFGRVAATGEGERNELYAEPDDTWYSFDVFKPEGAGARRVAVVFKDITERREQQQELRETRELLEVALEVEEMGVWELDLQTRQSPFRSSRHDEIFGYEEPVEDWSLERALDHVHPDDREMVREQFDAALDSGDWEFESRIVRTDGDQRWIKAKGTFFSEDGVPTRGVGTVQDVTTRKEAERDLQQQAERASFRVGLTDAIRPLSDPEAIERTAAQVLGEELAVDRANYGEVLADENTNVVHADYYCGDVASIAGEYRLDEYGSYIAEAFRAGETVVVEDVSTIEELSEEERTVHEAAEIAALIGVPLVKDDRLSAYFVVTHSTPREWTQTAVEMVEETAERTWGAVERARAEQELREAETRLQNIFENDMVPMAVWTEDGQITDANEAFLELLGYTREELDAGGLSGTERTPSEYRDRDRTALAEIEETGSCTPYEKEFLHKDGHRIPVVIIGGEFDPRRDRGILLAVDITERKEAEEALRASEAALERLTEATRELIDAETATIVDRVAPLVRDVLDVEYAALWRYDEQAGDLREYDVDIAPDVDDDPVAFPSGITDRVWETFVGSEIRVERDLGRSDVPPRLRSVAFVPLGRHGVVCVGSLWPDTLDERTLDLLETVGATVQTTWDRAYSEQHLADRNEELTRLNRLNTLIRGIGQALVATESRAEIGQAVCDRLADSDLYEFAWIGTHDPGTDVVEPQAWAGVDSGYLEDLTVTVANGTSVRDPIAQAVQTGNLQVISDIATDSRFAPWREATLTRGARSVICIPLVYDDSTYGVLTVYAGRPQSGEDERDHQVLSELGELIAHTINARETEMTLQTNSVIELTLRVGNADTPLCRLARQADCTIEYQGFVPRSNGHTDVFFVASGTTPAELETTAAELFAFDDFDCLTEGPERSLYRARVSDPTVAGRITAEGAVVRSLDIDADGATVVLDVHHTVAVREFLDRLRHWEPDFELRGRTSRERPLKTRESFVAALEDRLTDRQREILQTAYLSGFFEMPRVSNGQEVTELLNISQPTFSEHLRAAERTLCEVLFETEVSE